MKISLVAMDMDGTLLDHDQNISEETTKRLIALQEKGVRLALVSGRVYNRLKRYVKQLKLEEYGGFLIEVNGMAINDLKNHKRTVLERLSQQQAHELFDLLRAYEVEVQFIQDDAIDLYLPESIKQMKKQLRKEMKLPEDYPWTAGANSNFFDARDGYHHIRHINESKDIKTEINKVGIPADVDTLERMMKELQELNETYWTGRTTPTWLEIMPVSLSKGKALTMLCEQLQIPLSEVMCFGDGENDISMMKVCGYPIAMSNAMDIVKEIAYDITVTDNDHDGVVKTLEHYGV